MSRSSGKLVPVCNKQLKTGGTTCSPVNISTTNCRCSNHYNNTDGQHSHMHKKKRYKTRSERSQGKSSGEGASKSKSHHRRHHHQTSKDKARFHHCCQSSSHCPPRRDSLFPKSFPAAQEPSIITDSRLIGHHGLFNHEVKSIDIERMLSKQRKLEKHGERGVQENNMTALHPVPQSYFPSSCSSSDVMVANTKKKADPVTKAHQVCQEKEKTICQSNSQGSNITPGQRPQHQLDISSESDNSVLLSTNSTPDILITSNRAKSVVSETDRATLTTSCEKENVRPVKKKVKGQLNSHILQHLPKNQDPQHHQTKTCGPSPNPLQLSGSPIAGTSDSCGTQTGGGPDCMSSVAARLCACLQLPLQRRRNLVAESRERLVQALRERHGPLLQENLLKVQQRLIFGTGHTRAAQSRDEGASPIDTDGIWSTGAFNTDFQVGNVGQTCHGTKKTASFNRRKQRRSNWMSPPQPRQSPDQAVEWMTSPNVENVGNPLDELLRPSSSSQFCTDFQPSAASSPSHLFSPSPTSCWKVQASPFQPWGDLLNRAARKESVSFDCFENDFFGKTKAATEGSSGPQYCESSRQSLPRYPADPRHFPQAHDLFEIDRGSFVPYSSRVPYPQKSNQLSPSYHFSHPPNGSSLTSHHTNMMHYPPSHMLERDPSPLPFFPSPEPWNFPPLRLY